MRAPKLHLFFSIIQVIQIRNCFLLKQNEISDDIVYPLLYRTPRDKRDISDNTKEKLLIIRTSNTTFYIELIPNNELLSEDFEFEGFTYENHSSNPCLFHGKILSQSGGMAAISTCEGDGKMHGLLIIPEGKYIMQPASSMQPHLDFPPVEKESVPHVLLKNSEDIENFCATDHIAPPVDIEENEIPNVHVRKRRSNPRYTIRMAVFVDKTLIDHYSDKKVSVKFAVLNILNQVQFIYKYDSLKIKINIQVVKLELNDGKDVPDNANGDIDKFLNNFCEWQRDEKQKNGGDWNFSVQLTGMDLYKVSGNTKNTKVLGLTWVNGICQISFSCTICEGLSFEAAFVISHEMGHSLSMLHDGSNNSCNPDKYIMSPKTGPGKTNWSPCSVKYLLNFLKMPRSHCLLDNDKNAHDLTSDMDPRLPGEKYPPRVQCEYALGKGYKVYNNSKPPYNNVCRELWCVQGYWATPAHPALEGSSCGQDKICLQGDCVKKLKSTPRKSSPTERSVVNSKVENNNENKSPTILDKIRDFWKNLYNRYLAGK